MIELEQTTFIMRWNTRNKTTSHQLGWAAPVSSPVALGGSVIRRTIDGRVFRVRALRPTIIPTACVYAVHIYVRST